MAAWPLRERIKRSAYARDFTNMKTAIEEATTARQRSQSTSESARAQFAVRYREVRALSQDLCRPLQTEDYVIQSMPDASPAKWHLAHTSWFFETFVLKTGL